MSHCNCIAGKTGDETQTDTPQELPLDYENGVPLNNYEPFRN